MRPKGDQRPLLRARKVERHPSADVRRSVNTRFEFGHAFCAGTVGITVVEMMARETPPCALRVLVGVDAREL
jgi:hypothetical protein